MVALVLAIQGIASGIMKARNDGWKKEFGGCRAATLIAKTEWQGELKD
jgi:hypothetical protein